MQLVVATTNEGKLKELRDILGDSGFTVEGLGERESSDELETGDTFAENALLKARYYHKRTGLPVIADDSGLEVEALGGAPGIYSARYAGPGASDADRVAQLLKEMSDVAPENRSARFVCAAAVVWQGGEQVFVDDVHGVILTEPRGYAGFGYDPVFFHLGLGQTFAELTPRRKAQVSHRGRAFRRLGQWLRAGGVLDTPGLGDRIDFPTADSSAS